MFQIADGEWTEWKRDVATLEHLIGPEHRAKLKREFGDLERKALALDGRIAKYMREASRTKRHEARVLAKLAPFQK